MYICAVKKDYAMAVLYGGPQRPRHDLFSRHKYIYFHGTVKYLHGTVIYFHGTDIYLHGTVIYFSLQTFIFLTANFHISHGKLSHYSRHTFITRRVARERNEKRKHGGKGAGLSVSNIYLWIIN